jgi:hypothetical protein
MPSTTYILGGTSYAGKAAVERQARTILRSGGVPRLLAGTDAMFIHDLLSLHERAAEKIGRGVRALWVKANIYGDAGFFIERVDGTWSDFSYKKCLTPISRATQVRAAMRLAVASQIGAFKRAAFAASRTPGYVRCELSGELLSWDDVHIDHAYPRTFVALLGEWLHQRGETEDDVPIGPHPSGQGVALADAAYAAAWQAWHAERAVLRAVKAAINIARGARP